MEPIKFEDVLWTYSGKNGKCCCGCSGNYRTTTQNRELAGKERGYEYDDEEVSDRGVKIILNKINKNLDKLEQDSETQWALKLHERLYMVKVKAS